MRMRSRPPGPGREQLLLESSSVRLGSLVREAIAGVLQRPGRSILTAVGTVLGVGAFVAVVGIVSSANGQVTEEFTRLAATQFAITSTEDAVRPIPRNADTRIDRIEGVISAGTYTAVSGLGVSPSYDAYATGSQDGAAEVLAVSDGFWETVDPTVKGRVFDGYLASQNVAVIGIGLARELNIATAVGTPVIRVGSVPFSVIGIETATARVPDTLLAVVIPERAAIRMLGERALSSSDRRMIVHTDVGAAERVAEQVPLALTPADPGSVTAVLAQRPTKLQDRISQQLQLLFIAVAAILLLVGTIGIANTTLIAVLERVPEIGLRRAVGARPGHIGSQFLLESLTLGALGGLVGTSVGTVTVLAVCVSKDWTAILPTWVVPAGPCLGAATGLIAGVYPALRAARVEPVEAFRR